MEDTTMNYSGFDRDIKDAFNEIIIEFRFTFYRIWNGCYELRNSYCILRFNFDRGDVSCSIRPVSSEVFGEGIIPIVRYLFPNDYSIDAHKIYDPRDQLFEYAIIIREKLANVIQGDFSWLEEFLKNEDRIRKMTGYIWDKLEKNDPIYIKFTKGDQTWQSDLEAYLLQNNIQL
jgi:hypothetical protein